MLGENASRDFLLRRGRAEDTGEIPFQVAQPHDADEFVLGRAGGDETLIARVVVAQKLNGPRNPRGLHHFVENERAELFPESLGFAVGHGPEQNVFVDVREFAEARDAALCEVVGDHLLDDLRAVLLEEPREGFRFDVHGIEDDAVEIENDRADHVWVALARPVTRFCAASSSMRLRVARA